MKLAVWVISTAMLSAAVAGAFVLRGGEYAMFLLALCTVSFFGSMPVVLGVLSRQRPVGGMPSHDDGEAEVIRGFGAAANEDAGAASEIDPQRGAAPRTGGAGRP